MDHWNIVILGVQAIILVFQLILSWKMHSFERFRNKPYFSIKSNWPVDPWNENRFKYNHNLRTSLRFKAKGDSLVCVCGSSLSVDGVCKDPDSIPTRTFYEPNSDFSTLEVPLNLNKQELEKDKIDVVYMLKLQNQEQYKYKQTFYMTFEKDNETDFWTLKKYNFNITTGH